MKDYRRSRKYQIWSRTLDKWVVVMLYPYARLTREHKARMVGAALQEFCGDDEWILPRHLRGTT